MIDYPFVVKMLQKQYKHLEGVKGHIEFAIADYDRQIASLEKLDQTKYGNRIREVHLKLQEAFEKLSHIEPNMRKINEQVAEIKTNENT
jgi:prefoldin subunit 5